MLIYNVHTLQKTFALTHKEGESFDSLFDRIVRKGGLTSAQIKGIKSGQDGGLVYEFKGDKYSLEDDDDLSILHERVPPASSPAVTLHLTSTIDAAAPHAHAHFAPTPPSYHTAAGNIKSKAQKSSAQSNGNGNGNSNGSSIPSALKNSKSSETNGSSPKSKPSASTQQNSGSAKLAPPLDTNQGTGRDNKSQSKDKESEDKSKSVGGGEPKTVGQTAGGLHVGMIKPGKRAKSVTSTRSRKSRYGGDEDAEPMHVVHKRNWEAFHANSGVRTVLGEVGGVKDVRMLFKSGYRNVYVSRQFAVKNGMVDSKYGMGSSGYTGLKSLGNISITVGSKTATHLAMINEEQHFDVVLGRSWLEKTGVKIDPIDQTLLTYMDNGEVIPCDIVVLKNDKGEKIFIT